jgi:hypothetical protein
MEEVVSKLGKKKKKIFTMSNVFIVPRGFMIPVSKPK